MREQMRDSRCRECNKIKRDERYKLATNNPLQGGLLIDRATFSPWPSASPEARCIAPSPPARASPRVSTPPWRRPHPRPSSSPTPGSASPSRAPPPRSGSRRWPPPGASPPPGDPRAAPWRRPRREAPSRAASGEPPRPRRRRTPPPRVSTASASVSSGPARTGG